MSGIDYHSWAQRAYLGKGSEMVRFMMEFADEVRKETLQEAVAAIHAAEDGPAAGIEGCDTGCLAAVEELMEEPEPAP